MEKIADSILSDGGRSQTFYSNPLGQLSTNRSGLNKKRGSINKKNLHHLEGSFLHIDPSNRKLMDLSKKIMKTSPTNQITSQRNYNDKNNFQIYDNRNLWRGPSKIDQTNVPNPNKPLHQELLDTIRNKKVKPLRKIGRSPRHSIGSQKSCKDSGNL